MSYVATIKRETDKPPLTPEEFVRLIEADESLSGGHQEPIVWTNPASGETFYINAETDRLWTDDLGGDSETRALEMLDKLRNIAGELDARVYGDGEEDITEPSNGPPNATGCTAIIACLAALTGIAISVGRFLT